MIFKNNFFLCSIYTWALKDQHSNVEKIKKSVDSVWLHIIVNKKKFTAYSCKAVSYTHLDVYKRQT